MRPAIFLDRDGVIIENRPAYVRSWADVAIYPQALRALAAAAHVPYLFVMVTNQSVVGRGFISLETAQAINDRLVGRIRQEGGRMDAVYMCPHAPKDRCACRKPLPGMLHDAARELNLDLGRSVMIGDALSDMEAGLAAGVSHCLLVRTGRGRDQALLLAGNSDRIAEVDTLADALALFS